MTLDMYKTQIQETGKATISYPTVAELVEIVNDLGLDPHKVEIEGFLSPWCTVHTKEND